MLRLGRWFIVLALFLPLLGNCGGERDVDIHIQVSGRGTETSAVESPAPPTEMAATPLAAAPVPEDTQAPEPLPSEALPTEGSPPAEALPTGGAPAEEPTSAPTGALPQPPPTGAPPLPTAGPVVEGEAFTLDPDAWQQSTTILASFRQRVVLNFTADGTGLKSKATYDGEVTTNPAALHAVLVVEGEATAQLPSNRVELIWIGDEAWVKVGRRPWVKVPVTALESEYAGEVVGVGELLPFVTGARRVLPDETVNGIVCQHYVYDLNNLENEAGLTSAQGDIWVAKDGGYVVRLTLAGHGTYYGTYQANGTLNLVYDLYDVNAPIQIAPPR